MLVLCILEAYAETIAVLKLLEYISHEALFHFNVQFCYIDVIIFCLKSRLRIYGWFFCLSSLVLLLSFKYYSCYVCELNIFVSNEYCVISVVPEGKTSKLERHMGCHILPTCMPTGFIQNSGRYSWISESEHKWRLSIHERLCTKCTYTVDHYDCQISTGTDSDNDDSSNFHVFGLCSNIPFWCK